MPMTKGEGIYPLGKRVKYRTLRGTVLAYIIGPYRAVMAYKVRLDVGGVNVSGTKFQFAPVKRLSRFSGKVSRRNHRHRP